MTCAMMHRSPIPEFFSNARMTQYLHCLERQIEVFGHMPHKCVCKRAFKTLHVPVSIHIPQTKTGKRVQYVSILH